MEIPALASEESLDAFVRAFEDGAFPLVNYHHAEHLIVATAYLSESTDALTRMRANIRHYNEAQGGKNTDEAGYHETLTVFWLALVRANLPSASSRLEAARAMVGLFAPLRDVFRHFYSFNVVKSREARLSWVSPDLPGPDDSAFSVPVWRSIQT